MDSIVRDAMTAPAPRSGTHAEHDLILPPLFRLVPCAAGEDALTTACALAAQEGAGTLTLAPQGDWLDFAVVLEPGEALAPARRAFFVAMEALIEALGSVAPPEKPLLLRWPGALLFDGARLGGGRLAWPEGCRDDETPDWLVFGATLIASKESAGDPGLTPESTSLAEEGFEPEDGPRLVEAFAKHLMRGFASWQDGGFESATGTYLARLSGTGPGSHRIGPHGDLVPTAGPDGTLSLLPQVSQPDWLDAATGRPRL